MTKVDAVVKVLKAKGGSASWAEIYKGITKFYPEAKASKFWQEGIRGVVYREMRYGRTFDIASKGVVALKGYYEQMYDGLDHRDL